MADNLSRTGVEFYANQDILNYLARLHAPHDAALQQAFDSPAKDGMPPIMVGPLEGKLISTLVRLSRVRSAIEVGTLAGYSTIHLARALLPGGHLHTIESDPLHAKVAQLNITDAGLAGVVTVHVGVATQVLTELASAAPFDAMFIDADKGNYDVYGRFAAQHLRRGGLLIADNVFFFRRLLDENEPAAQAMRRFHEEAVLHFDTTCIPTPDGLLLGVKRSDGSLRLLPT